MTSNVLHTAKKNKYQQNKLQYVLLTSALLIQKFEGK